MPTKERCQIRYNQLLLSNQSWYSFTLYLFCYLLTLACTLVVASAKGLRKINKRK